MYSFTEFVSQFPATSFWVALVTLLFLWYVMSQRKPKNFPAGPWGLPVLGHLPLLGLNPHETTLKWKAKYGPIIGLKVGSFPAVIISDYKMLKEAWNDSAFVGRPQLNMPGRSGDRHMGIIMSQGKAWREQRQWTHRRLKEMGGVGSKSIGVSIVDQSLQALDVLRADLAKAPAGTPISIHGRFSVPSLNVLWAIIAGSPFPLDDPDFKRLARLVQEGFAEADLFGTIGLFVPWFEKYFPDWITHSSGIQKQYMPALNFVKPYIEEHWATHTLNEPRDFIDAYIDEIKATSDPESTFHERFKQYNLATVLLDIVIGGAETSALSMDWVCLILATYPEVQEKMAAEIENVIGLGSSRVRDPTLEDKRAMPYTEALINEIWRYKPLLPFGAFHSTLEDVHFHGFDIPKGTVVFLNTYEAHFSKEMWGDPENFRPERWINTNEDGTQEFVRREGFLAFSAGKRVCLGEQLARDEVFLFTAVAAQAFEFVLDPNSPPPSLEPKKGGTTDGPQPYKLIVKERR